MDIPQSLLDLAKKTEKGEYPLHDLRSSFKKYPDEIVLEICSGIINNYREHKNFFMAVMLSEEIENRNGIKYLDAVRTLEELVRNLNVKLSLRRLLEANIELLEIEANDDFENIRCRCEVYVKYAMLPESCRGIEIISKEDPS
ncbi:MAG: hypothetical protein GY754_17970, partial [bacterium]|nr:hypothetical protein [bacterium]